MTILIETLRDYAHYATFVETGTYRGNTVQKALDAGFTRIHTIEIDDGLFRKARERFKDRPEVNLHKGDSIVCLKSILAALSEPAVFWLDAHRTYADEGLLAGGAVPCPVMEELALLADHPIKEHTILIDDRRLLGQASWGSIEEATVIDRLLSINPEYRIVYHDCRFPADVIVASLPHNER